MKVMAIRPEAINLRPSTRTYMQKVLHLSPDIGLRSARKDFLEKVTDKFDIKKVRKHKNLQIHYPTAKSYPS